jgi:hypothetical protein
VKELASKTTGASGGGYTAIANQTGPNVSDRQRYMTKVRALSSKELLLLTGKCINRLPFFILENVVSHNKFGGAFFLKNEALGSVLPGRKTIAHPYESVTVPAWRCEQSDSAATIGDDRDIIFCRLIKAPEFHRMEPVRRTVVMPENQPGAIKVRAEGQVGGNLSIDLEKMPVTTPGSLKIG